MAVMAWTLLHWNISTAWALTWKRVCFVSTGIINIEVLSKTNWQGYVLLFITSRDDLLCSSCVCSVHISPHCLILLAPAPDWAPSIGSGPGCQAAGPPSTLGQHLQSQANTKLNWELGNNGNPLVTPYINCNLHILYDALVSGNI